MVPLLFENEDDESNPLLRGAVLASPVRNELEIFLGTAEDMDRWSEF